MGRAVAQVVRRSTGGREKWRAEVGPMLPGAGPRPLCYGLARESSFERLVFADYVTVTPNGLMGINSLGRLVLKTNTKFAV